MKQVILFIIVILISFFLTSCNKGVWDLEDGTGITHIDSMDNSHIVIGNLKPKSIDDYYYYPTDTSSFLHFGFEYDNSNSRIEYITYGNIPFYYFKYNADTIKVLTANLAKDSNIAILQDNRVVNMPIFNTTFTYDSNNYLVKRVNAYDSIQYYYSEGNLIKKVEDMWLLGPNTITTEYEYYDSIEINSNANYFPFTGYESNANVGRDFEFRYLDIFGKLGSKLIKYVTISGSQINIPYKYRYIWTINNSRIDKLEIQYDTSITRKFVYRY